MFCRIILEEYVSYSRIENARIINIFLYIFNENTTECTMFS